MRFGPDRLDEQRPFLKHINLAILRVSLNLLLSLQLGFMHGFPGMAIQIKPKLGTTPKNETSSVISTEITEKNS